MSNIDVIIIFAIAPEQNTSLFLKSFVTNSHEAKLRERPFEPKLDIYMAFNRKTERTRRYIGKSVIFLEVADPEYRKSFYNPELIFVFAPLSSVSPGFPPQSLAPGLNFEWSNQLQALMVLRNPRLCALNPTDEM
jgi:hypothetical protein